MTFKSALFLCVALGATAITPALHAQESQSPPATVQTGSFQTGGDTIYYHVAGSGPAILVIHGFPLAGALFNGQVNVLSQTHTVIIPDLPGFGQSTTGNNKQTDDHYAADMLALLTHLGVSTAIIGGHSMGGQITLDMYRLQPSVFKGMILFDTNPAAASIVEMAEWPAYGRQAEKLGVPSIAPSVVGVMVTGEALAAEPQLGMQLTTIVDSAGPKGVAGGGHALATRPDYTSLLSTINVPTLVICGQDDTVYPLPISQMLAGAIPGATLDVVPAAAHASMFQRPGMVDNDITTWLASHGL